MNESKPDPEKTDDSDESAVPPVPDADAMKDAHGKLGSYLKKGGLPFEPDEFDEQERASDKDWPDDDGDRGDDENEGFEAAQAATEVEDDDGSE